MTEQALKAHQGSCHCGAVRFEAETTLDGLLDCNCSRCSRLGWVLQPVPAAHFKLLSGEDKLTNYHFNTHKIDHLFCSVCGVQSFGRGKDGEGNPVYMVNVNCLENVEIDRNTVYHWDGKSA